MNSLPSTQFIKCLLSYLVASDTQFLDVFPIRKGLHVRSRDTIRSIKAFGICNSSRFRYVGLGTSGATCREYSSGRSGGFLTFPSLPNADVSGNEGFSEVMAWSWSASEMVVLIFREL